MMKLDEFYAAVQGDLEDAMSRFMGEQRVVKFLRMLPKDPSMDELDAAMAAGDAERAFRAAHTLKGISLNLGLTALASASSDLTEALRGSSVLPADTGLYTKVKEAYGIARTALDQLEV